MVYRTPAWDDFVQLSCREIRFYGASNFQVARRLRAMLENLPRARPAECPAAVLFSATSNCSEHFMRAALNRRVL